VEALSDKALAALLLSLRIAPTLGFAPPFTLLRIPGTVRMLLAVALAAWLVTGHPAQTWQSDFQTAGLAIIALTELLLGVTLSLALQLAFAALLTVGRAIDLQAGFGLATLIDPSSRAGMPLIGTLFVYAAGAIFFATGGLADLLAIWEGSIAQIPLGAAPLAGNLSALGAYASAIFLMAFGAAGVAMLVLFLIDLAIAFMSRTLPQMNVLMLGFQVKTLATLLVLPIALALSASLYLRMIRFALQTATDLI
jgi:flagellar biosynthetic protein FliR